jgi:hypothetical protein
VADVIAPTRVPTRPTSSRGSQCSPKIDWTPSSPPAAITSSAPPGMTSSAGWNTSRTRPGSSGADASASPAAMSMVVWASWPQACAAPGTPDAYGSPVSSVSGSASMSARSATQRSPVPTSQVSPVPLSKILGRSPAADNSPATSSVVANSRRDSSGLAWMCRYQASTSSALRVSHSSNHAGPRPAPMSSTVGILTPLSVMSTPTSSAATSSRSLDIPDRESSTVTRSSMCRTVNLVIAMR